MEFGGHFRYIVLTISLLHFAMLMATTIAFNATFVSTMNKKTSPLFNGSNDNDITVDWASDVLPIAHRRYSYGFREKTMAFAGLYIGSPFIAFALNALMKKHGTHKVMLLVGFLSSVITASTPFLIATSFPLFIISRFLAGISISNIFPVAGIVCNKWGTVNEKGLFIAVISAYIELSCLFSTPISGGAGLPSFLFTQWLLDFVRNSSDCCRDDPADHQFVNSLECLKIKTPYRAILRTPALWASWIATFGHIVACNFAVSFFAMCLTYGLHFDTVSAGIIPIGPMAVMLVIKFISGYLSDKIKFVSELNRSRIFNSFGLYGSGFFFILAGFLGPINTTVDTILIATAVSIMGFCAGGYPKTVVLVARQHTAFAMTILQILVFTGLIFGSLSIPILTKNVSFGSWQNVFLTIGVLHLITNTFYIIFARAEPAAWTKAIPGN